MIFMENLLFKGADFTCKRIGMSEKRMGEGVIKI